MSDSYSDTMEDIIGHIKKTIDPQDKETTIAFCRALTAYIYMLIVELENE